jgi:biotin carboxyl carrier protein
VPDAGPQRQRATGGASQDAAARSAAAARQADHESIDRLTEDLLPALIAKLGTTHLGELEVREGDWHVRLRRPYGTAPGEGRRSTDKPSRTQPGHEGHGHGRAAPEGYRSPRAASGATAGTGAASASSNGTGAPEERNLDKSRAIATSPAVGIFQPGSRAASGTRVRAGDSLGAVNVLGVPQDVLAPVDGVVGSTLVDPGDAVEYGQELIRIELAAAPPASEARS